MLTSHEIMVAKQKRQNQKDKRSSNQRSGNTFADNPTDFDEVNYHEQRQKFGNSDGNVEAPSKKKSQGQQRKTRHYALHPSQRRQNSNQSKSQHSKPQENDPYSQGYVPQVQEGKVYEGIVQNYYREKGYGFIRCEDFEVPAFFHYSEIQLEGFKYLIKQQKVEFKARVSDEGKLQAFQVTPTELAPTQKRQIFNKDKPEDN